MPHNGDRAPHPMAAYLPYPYHMPVSPHHQAQQGALLPTVPASPHNFDMHFLSAQPGGLLPNPLADPSIAHHHNPKKRNHEDNQWPQCAKRQATSLNTDGHTDMQLNFSNLSWRS
eukprot:CAMPEP_0177686828 /NCGR_PEP_ID=MMETSP0447-20121125/33786_1 /TAXON_ID=0 /ORGANISM="Stygamoeba regulata, Strain BSH-02190019" /LENGTH=114 /DNA_ID=CAMNT_0019196995 /DNA_START=322 /DNA_END=666 /DNA_ORIENTATION=+